MLSLISSLYTFSFPIPSSLFVLSAVFSENDILLLIYMYIFFRHLLRVQLLFIFFMWRIPLRRTEWPCCILYTCNGRAATPSVRSSVPLRLIIENAPFHGDRINRLSVFSVFAGFELLQGSPLFRWTPFCHFVCCYSKINEMKFQVKSTSVNPITMKGHVRMMNNVLWGPPSLIFS